MSDLTFTDRYDALGIHPDPATSCKAGCEGIGWVPISPDEQDPILRALANEVHMSRCPKEYARYMTECDGWHFVRCQKCNGTGLELGNA